MSGLYWDLVFAGTGGQGVMLLGQLVAHVGTSQGMHVSWNPSYGGEMRGGMSKCTLILSDEEIGDPLVKDCQTAVIMHPSCLEEFSSIIRPGGYFIYDSDLVHPEKESQAVRSYGIPATSIAVEVGNPRVSNLVLLGSLAEISRRLDSRICRKILEKQLGDKKPEMIPLNLRAFERGREEGQVLL
ncbi:MAG TPA: 2-oxoacid:acceptor oxidoreductase family protein [Synergistales bacterium]|nr:2-oxoacid:acceptor oxidoreductase family protein [Synergistales bacterium]